MNENFIAKLQTNNYLIDQISSNIIYKNKIKVLYIKNKKK